MDTHRHLLLRDIINRYCQFVSQSVNGVYLNDFVNNSLSLISDEIADQIINSDPVWRNNEKSNAGLSYKKTKYNLCIIDRNRKYKIYIGLNSIISRKNYMLAKDLFVKNPLIKSTMTIEKDLYRIECCDYITGMTVRELLEKEDADNELSDYKNVDALYSLVETFVKNNYKPDNDNYVYYPNDSQSSNLLIINKSKPKIILIDFDHIIKHKPKDMIDNFVERFFAHITIFYKNARIEPFWFDYINSNPLDVVKNHLRERLINVYK